MFLSNAVPWYCVIDIKAHVDYIPLHRRLRFAFCLSGIAYHFEVAIIDGSPRFG
jgi:hypothetical protein